MGGWLKLMGGKNVQKRLMWVFSPKLQCEDETDRPTDRQTDGRTDFPDSLLVAKKKKVQQAVFSNQSEQLE